MAGSVTFFGQDIKLFSEGSIGGDLNGAAQHIMLSGPVERSVLIGGQSLTLQSTVGGNVDAAVERVDMINSAQVAGDLNYQASSELSINESAVGGTVNFTPATQQQSSDAIKFILLFLTTIAVCALLIILLAPRFVERNYRKAADKPLVVALVGFVVLVGTPLLAVALMASVVLMPLGIMALALLMAAIVASQAFFAYFLGSLVLRQQQNILVRGLAGVVLLFALYLIPVLNAFVGMVSVLFGVGMVVSTVLDGYRRPRYSLSEVTPPKV